MALPQEKQLTWADFKARMAMIQAEQRARMFSTAPANVRRHVEHEVRRGYSLDEACDLVLERIVEGRAPVDYVALTRRILKEIGWTPKRERA
ncbi:hypothetical protein [Paraburkholderia sacchari]|uniref:hypothetical protein n=1 Tax=Paraburkholderia sacchari TaxID=159450 RepID=UPI000541D26A|nr:hypothetical protein [Paraburkholderia sacchari]NLP64301.1 hypothetical protein [Paraburkholderia sacchari]